MHKTIVNTVSDAKSPCRKKRHSNDRPELYFGGLWGHFGVTLGTKWNPRDVFLEVRILMGKRSLQQLATVPRRGGVPLKQLEAGGWRPEVGGWRLPAEG